MRYYGSGRLSMKEFATRAGAQARRARCGWAAPFGTDLTVPGYPAAALRALVPVRFLRAPVIGLATVDPARVRVASRDRHLSR